jgi:transcriptional regulator with XRE-family HTH domain
MLCVFRMSYPVSMRDVAEAAGVSKSTVSKVLSGKGSALRISPAMQRHVRSIASQLDYVPGPIILYRPAETYDRRETTSTHWK